VRIRECKNEEGNVSSGERRGNKENDIRNRGKRI
jgi:hypothetical protein